MVQADSQSEMVIRPLFQGTVCLKLTFAAVGIDIPRVWPCDSLNHNLRVLPQVVVVIGRDELRGPRRRRWA